MRKEYFLLPEDRAWLDARVNELEKVIQDMGPEFYDALNQSSESWHDNAPFDALRERQSVHAAELAKLKHIRLSSVPTMPRPKRGTVGVGSVISLDTQRRLGLAGHWTHRAGQVKDGLMIVSLESPIGKAVFGKKVGDMTPFGTINGIE